MPLYHTKLGRTEGCSKPATKVQVKSVHCLIGHFTEVARFNPWRVINGNRLKTFVEDS